MGFEVLYFPPIHPIGRTQRKGRNNTPQASPDDPGSPWAIGDDKGGHVAIHPHLGTIEDFKELQKKARELGIEIALDLAFQCSPDHPYVKEHKEWFLQRADGSVQYAENPPKKYEDIYPFYFESEYATELSDELKRVVFYWMEQGVRIFRVDNPHTKPFDFWEWLIKEARRKYPEVIFLSEAFTRPKVMRRLAKLGFS
jgi:starch synthase (maltosyl-transferring)